MKNTENMRNIENIITEAFQGKKRTSMQNQ